ncbi:TRAP-type C4-dicarboxylate transport system, large permease component [Acinetobacter marinus]|uniref:TRAP-type C4-dicarboxylate transport system, large permease component n=1 Tax=Acinetobacter marinus TaxID=281375 RepID=A0A1G6LFL5_9GAMM|nr:TRAP transporter large permease subunit [Acinetobacter marinus]SDC41376.1 TRAP-type C4-dicarboxylate transport system, large permease component [Acinetobacter marinus]
MQDNHSHDAHKDDPGKPRNGFEWLSTIAIFFLLLLTLIIGTGEMIHGQLLRVGEQLYGDPDTGMQYSFLRAEPQQPSCERNIDVDAAVQRQMAENKNDEFADFFGVASEEEVRESILAGQQSCEEKHQFYDRTLQHMDAHPSVRTYRAFETGFSWIVKFGTDHASIVLMLMFAISSVVATLNIHHIGLRAPSTKLDYKVYGVAMVIGNAFLLSATYFQYRSELNSGLEIETGLNIIYLIWFALFGLLTLISLVKLIRPPTSATGGGRIGLAFLSVPLYAYMAILTGIVFTFFMNYPMGQAIRLLKLIEFSSIFLSLSLFIWVGMLLKRTRVVDLFLNILRPWNFAPETLTWLILLAAALPTAYTGASGIFVIAAGAIIYREVWNAGGRRQYAIAAAAMSGSLGVVLRPCLLIVVIASLNKQVKSDELYHYGVWVFVLTSTLFLIISLILAKEKFRIASPAVAFPNSAKALVPVSPYIVIAIAVWAFYKFALDTNLNEFTAQVIMPIILLAMVLFDSLRKAPEPQPATGHWDESLQDYEHANAPTHEPRENIGFFKSVSFATFETIGHIGALVILMALSVSVGGYLEMIKIMEMMPTDLNSILMALTMLAILMVFVGMVMDPFGAVILISATVAPVAYQYGIHPIHFWMIALISFELGYVSPPVALNQLLARQSIGDAEVAEADAEVRHMSFYYRFERWLLPLMVMFPAMLIVTFMPYLLKLFGWYQ